jgi:hypothetical protein
MSTYDLGGDDLSIVMVIVQAALTRCLTNAFRLLHRLDEIIQGRLVSELRAVEHALASERR